MKDKDIKITGEISTDGKFNYRYVCPACTNVAFYSNGKTNECPVTCKSCGKYITELKQENYIKL